MKSLYLMLAMLLCMPACSKSADVPVDTPDVQPTASTVTPRQHYTCRSGKTIEVSYYETTNAVTLSYNGSDMEMGLASATDNSRFVSGILDWQITGRSKGAIGTLSRLRADGTTGDVIERCVAD